MTCQTSLAPNLRESIRCFSIINSHLNWCFQTNNKLTPGLKNTKSIYWPNTNKMTKSPLKILKAPRTSPSFPHGIYKNLFLIFLPLTLHLPPCNQPFFVMHWFTGLSRCGKSCRLRWLNYLQPDVKWGNYTEEEELMIIKLHEELGNKYRDLNLY